jgi:hypothetical protein
MTEFAASRFPALAAPEPARTHRSDGLGLTLRLVPLPIGELSVLLTAWLLILPV